MIRSPRRSKPRFAARRSTAALSDQTVPVVEKSTGRRFCLFPAPRPKSCRSILADLSGRPILTVGDATGFLSDGGIIEFQQVIDDTLRFSINVGSADRSGLKISSDAMRVAYSITGRQNERSAGQGFHKGDFSSSMKNWPIRRKLVANSLITSSVALLLAGLLLIVFELRQTRLNVANELTSVGEMLGNNSTAPLIFNDRQAAQRSLNSLRAIQRIAVAGIAKPDGSWFASYTRSDFPKAALPRPLGPDGYRFDGAGMVLFQTLIVDGEKIGTVYLRSDMTEVTSKLEQYGPLTRHS